MAWTSDKPEVGAGSQEIIAVEPVRSVTTQLDFGPQGKATARIEAVPEGSGADALSYLLAIEELAWGSLSVAAACTMQSLMGTYFVHKFAAGQVRERLLGPALRGEGGN